MKKLLALAIVLMMVFATNAYAKELSEIKIGYILKPESNEYWSSMKAGVLAWAEEKGVQVDVQCVDDESNFTDRKSTRLNSSHTDSSRMPSSA